MIICLYLQQAVSDQSEEEVVELSTPPAKKKTVKRVSNSSSKMQGKSAAVNINIFMSL